MHLIRQLCLVPFLLVLQGEELPLQTDQIPTGKWVYEVTAGGSRFGELTSTIRRENDRIVSMSDLRGSRIQRGSLTVQSGSLVPIESSTFIYQPGEGSTTARITYASSADSLIVSGSIVWSGIGQAATTPVMIKESFPLRGWFDNQSVDLLISALPLESGLRWRANLFDPTSDRPVTITIRVVNQTSATTPAGSFSVWNVEVTGMAGRVVYLIECNTRVLVAQYLPEQDVRFELNSPLRPTQQQE